MSPGLGQPTLGAFAAVLGQFWCPRSDVLSLTVQLFAQNVEFSWNCITLLRGELEFGFPGGFAGVVRAGAQSVFGMFSAEFGFLQCLCLCCLEISAVTPIKTAETFSKKKFHVTASSSCFKTFILP